MKIMVSGLFTAESIKAATAAGADCTGLVFNARSEHNVTMAPTMAGIIPDRAGMTEPLNNLTAGIFTDEMPQNVITRVANYRLDMVLLDGDEQPTIIRNMKRTIVPDIRQGVKFWKTIRSGNSFSTDTYRKYDDCVDGYVLKPYSTPAPQQQDDRGWSIVETYRGSLPIIVSVQSGMVREAVKRLTNMSITRLWGIDIDTSHDEHTDMDSLCDELRHLKG